MDTRENEVRLWIVNRIAEVLADLADDGAVAEMDPEEILDQMRNVGDLIVESLGVEFVDSDGSVATIRVGDR